MRVTTGSEGCNRRFDPYVTACLWLGGEVVAAAALRLSLPPPPFAAAGSGAEGISHVQVVLQATAPHLRQRGLGLLLMRPVVLRHWRALDVAFIFVASIPLTWGLAYFVMPPAAAAALTAVAVGLALHAWHNAAALPAGADIDKKANTRYVGLVVLVYTFPIVMRGAQDLLATYGPGADGVWPAVATALGVDPLYGAKCAVAVAFCFVYGAAVYTSSFPDVYAPGLCDLVGSAQQLMHLAIAGAHVVEWLFAIHMYQRRLLMPL
ncbi:hypothetical protein HXX76_013063 [Chlamydomonas incerta]|uniref:Uncharacterized protein n=1 Tax=Chlamydomonas incerta TaxID=51695 RepID=A0A835SUY2_CHLIN|nr:hypothetical protein HXX76_013063 [Chlamydomonas incerta]|eukprot:KAG2426306.1 hypothetical protein HXX76_013063 [Chlamydomonas incerta]